MGYDLQRLAQAHVVCQDAAKAQALEGAQPPEAVLLVAAKRGLKPRRDVYVGVAVRLEVPHDPVEAGVALQAHAVCPLQELVYEQGARRGKARPSRGKLLHRDAQAVRKLLGNLEVVANAHQVTAGEPHVALLARKAVQVLDELLLGETGGAQLDVQQVALDRRAHRQARRRAHADAPQAL